MWLRNYNYDFECEWETPPPPPVCVFVCRFVYEWMVLEVEVAHQKKKKKDLGRKKRYYISWLVEHLFCNCQEVASILSLTIVVRKKFWRVFLRRWWTLGRGSRMFAFQTAIEQAAIKMDFFFFQCCYAYRGEKGSSQANLLSQKQVALAKNNPRNLCYEWWIKQYLIILPQFF